VGVDIRPCFLRDARIIEAIYNEGRLHCAIGYVTPRLRQEGRQERAFAEIRKKTGRRQAEAESATQCYINHIRRSGGGSCGSTTCQGNAGYTSGQLPGVVSEKVPPVF